MEQQMKELSVTLLSNRDLWRRLAAIAQHQDLAQKGLANAKNKVAEFKGLFNKKK